MHFTRAGSCSARAGAYQTLRRAFAQPPHIFIHSLHVACQVLLSFTLAHCCIPLALHFTCVECSAVQCSAVQCSTKRSDMLRASSSHATCRHTLRNYSGAGSACARCEMLNARFTRAGTSERRSVQRRERLVDHRPVAASAQLQASPAAATQKICEGIAPTWGNAAPVLQNVAPAQLRASAAPSGATRRVSAPSIQRRASRCDHQASRQRNEMHCSSLRLCALW